jgi:hypothetical protein
MSRNTEDGRQEAVGDEPIQRMRAKTFADLLVWQKAHLLGGYLRALRTPLSSD